MTRRLAVVGSGVAGLVAAHVLSRTDEVTLYEADSRLGGHADTHRVSDGGRELGIDTGFIVHNERTYPTLLRLFAELGVATQQSEMSMSISDRGTGVEWAGALGAQGVFPSWANLRPRYLRMLTEIPRFHRQAKALVASGDDDQRTLAAFLDDGGFSPYFVRHFMEPLVAAVWSCDPAVALDYPARYLFAFLEHHGMLGVFGSPPWRTVTGGSHAYVDKVAAGLRDGGHQIRLGTKITSVSETAEGVEIVDGNGAVSSYDAVVIATHPHQALAMLADPTPDQREVLSAMAYSPNIARLHTDTSLLPRARRAWASWNFRRPERAEDGLVVTYDLTRLQRLPTETHYLVTLGGTDLIDPATVIETMEYEHPLYTPASVAAQRRLPEISSDRIAFAGAYHGWGFHEDGARSGLAAAERVGGSWDAAPPPPPAPRVYDVTIRHARRTPLRHEFTYRSASWLVDLDDLPDHGPLARFEARDHLGAPDATLRANVDAFLAAHDIDLGGGRVLMLANPRVLGYSFNPISVFWCHDATGHQTAVIVEVHNTYGDRHAYLVHPDAHGKATIDKAMYVSPFHDVSGMYELAVPTPGEKVVVSVRLGDFTASMSGPVLPPGRLTVLRTALRHPATPLLGRLRITLQGIRLWRRGRTQGMPVQPRPAHLGQEGVQP